MNTSFIVSIILFLYCVYSVKSSSNDEFNANWAKVFQDSDYITSLNLKSLHVLNATVTGDIDFIYNAFSPYQWRFTGSRLSVSSSLIAFNLQNIKSGKEGISSINWEKDNMNRIYHFNPRLNEKQIVQATMVGGTYRNGFRSCLPKELHDQNQITLYFLFTNKAIYGIFNNQVITKYPHEYTDVVDYISIYDAHLNFGYQMKLEEDVLNSGLISDDMLDLIIQDGEKEKNYNLWAKLFEGNQKFISSLSLNSLIELKSVKVDQIQQTLSNGFSPYQKIGDKIEVIPSLTAIYLDSQNGNCFSSINWIKDSSNIVFHYRRSVQDGQLVQNTRVSANWGGEMRVPYPTEFCTQRGIKIYFLFTKKAIYSYFNDQLISTYPHRYTNTVNQIAVYDSHVISAFQVKMEEDVMNSGLISEDMKNQLLDDSMTVMSM